MIFQSFVFALFFLSFAVLQIVILNKFEFDGQFLKKGKDVSLKLFVTIILIFVLLAIGLIFLYFKADNLDRLLYLFSCVFLLGNFLTFFLIFKLKNILVKSLLAITIATALVSFVLFFQQPFLKNIITVTSLLWVSPLLFKYLNIKRIYFLVFLICFMLFDIYNIFFLTPTLSITYNYLFLNGYVEIEELMLGMGDFFLGFFVLGLLWSDRGVNRTFLLALMMSLFLFIINIFGFKHDIPFSVFIVIPTLIVYFCKCKILENIIK